MPAKEKTLNDLFLEALKDVYHAEKQLMRALPKMAKAAESEELRQAFQTHREETEGQIERLEQVFEIVNRLDVGSSLRLGHRDRSATPATALDASVDNPRDDIIVFVHPGQAAERAAAAGSTSE